MTSIEQRVILGTVFFVGILLLVGFVLIKEEARMAEFTRFYDSRSIERGAALFESNCSTCHGRQGQGVPGIAPALNNPRLFDLNRADNRLAEMGWAGGLRAYITNAVAAGRPNSGAYWPQAMPTWGQEFGGPLRSDQIDTVVDFIMNWEASALDEINPPVVAQDFVLPARAGGESSAVQVNASGQPVGTDVAAALAALPEGDPVRGDTLYHLTQLGCVGCHENGAVGPATAGTLARVENRIATDPALAGYTVDQYLVESIVLPNNYIVPEYLPNVMPPDLGNRLDIQDVADLVAFLKTQTGQ